jgi:SAM-dependent methyltransferase
MVTRDLRQSGRDHYSDLYDRDLQEEARWLEYGAQGKTDSVELLLQREGLRPKTILEIGCGPGAILRELQRRGIGEALFGVDYSESAIEYAASLSSGISYSQADVTAEDLTLPREHFDVVIVSHVIEHLEKPEPFLRALRRISFDALIVEVPLEDLWASRLKAKFRDRRMNRAGHVQFFTQRSFTDLLHSAGYEVVASRRYANVLSPEALRFAGKRNRFTRTRLLVSLVTGYCLPLYVPFWTRFYYAHFAAVLKPRSLGEVFARDAG